MGFGLGGEETKNRRIYKHTLRRSRYHAVLRLKSGHPTVLDRGITLILHRVDVQGSDWASGADQVQK
jgi:siroheme synthase